MRSSQTGNWWYADPDASFGPALGAGNDSTRWDVRAKVLVQLLTGLDELSFDASGDARAVRAVRVSGARIVGDFNLAGFKLRCPLEFVNCSFITSQPLDLSGTSTSGLRIVSCSMPRGLNAAQVEVNGNLDLRFLTSGDVVDLSQAQIAGSLYLQGSSLRSSGDQSLLLVSAKVGGGIFADRMQCRGTMDALNLQADFLKLDGAHLDSEGSTAFIGEGLRLQGNFLARQGARFDGLVSLRSAAIRGHLLLDGSSFNNVGQTALDLSNAEVSGDIACRAGFLCYGRFQMHDSKVFGSLQMNGASCHNPGDLAIAFDRLQVKGSWLCRGGFFADGTVSTIDAKIEGEVAFDAAVLTNPGGDTVRAERISVGASIFFRARARSVGRLNFSNAQVGGSVLLVECDLVGAADQVTCTLNGASVSDLMHVAPAEHHGVIDLRGAKASRHKGAAGIADRYQLQGYVYGAIIPEVPTVDLRNRLQWLRNDPEGYSPGPYSVLAGVLKHHGYLAEAKKTSIESQRIRRARTRGVRGVVSRSWSFLLRNTIGYGYKPGLAFAWLVITVAVGSTSIQLLRDKMVAGSGAPPFNSLIYVVDNMLPFVDFGYSKWVASGLAQIVTVATVLCGYVLVAAILAALAGVLRRGD